MPLHKRVQHYIPTLNPKQYTLNPGAAATVPSVGNLGQVERDILSLPFKGLDIVIPM